MALVLPEYGPWRSSLVGGGGFVQGVALVAKAPLRAYAWVDVGGLYRSDDGGKTWRMLQGALPNEPGSQQVRGLDADPADPDRLLVACGDHWGTKPSGVFLSTDGGTSFRRVLEAKFAGNGDHRWTGDVLARAGKTVLAGTLGDGLWRSADGGETWAKTGPEGLCFFTDVRFDPARPKIAWASARPYGGWWFQKEGGLKGGFLRSDDGGATWRALPGDAPSEILVVPKAKDRLVGLFRDGREVRLSEDGGSTWKPFSQGLALGEGGGPAETEYQALAALPDGTLLTASTYGTFYRRAPKAAEWTRLPEPRVTETYAGGPWNGAWDGKGWRHYGKALSRITVDPRDPKRWFFNDWFAIWQSRDAGASWNLSMDGVEVTVIHCLAADPKDPTRVHLGMADNGYLLSTNSGERFTSPHINSNTKSLSVCRADPRRLWATGDAGNGKWEASTVWTSLDGGASWAKVEGLPEGMRPTVVGDEGDPQRAWVAVSGPKGGVFRTEDGGKSWSPVGSGQADRFSGSIWVVGRELAAGGGDLVACSRDRGGVVRWTGERWEETLRTSGAPNDLVYGGVRGRFWLAVDGEGLYRTDDGGRTWTKALSQGGRRVAADGDRIAFGADAALMVSLDGGQTWRDESVGLPNRLALIPAFSGDRLLAGSNGSGVFWRRVR